MVAIDTADLSVGVYRATPDGDYLDVNQAMASLFDAASIDELRDLGPTALYPPGVDRDRVFSQRVVAEQRVQNHVMRLQTLDSEACWVETTAVCRVEDTDQPVFDGIVYDVTARQRQYQKSLRARDYAYGVRDEFQSLVSVIQDELNRIEQVRSGSRPGRTTQSLRPHVDQLDGMVDPAVNWGCATTDGGRREIDLTGLALGCWELLETTAVLDFQDEVLIRGSPARTRELLKGLFRMAIRSVEGEQAVRLGLLEDDCGFFVEGPGLSTLATNPKTDPTARTGGHTGRSCRESRTVHRALSAQGWDYDLDPTDDGRSRLAITGLLSAYPVR